MQVLIAALSVALCARTDQLTAHAVEDMRVKAEELLPKGDGLRCAIIDFATQYEQDRRDRAAMHAHGLTLQAALDEALGSGPVVPETPVVASDPVTQTGPPVALTRPGPAATEHHPWMDRSDING